MKVLFDIRGKQILCETDPAIPPDTVRVRSIDAFAALLSTIDCEEPAVEFEVHGKNGTKPLAHRKPPSAVIEVDSFICPPAPEGGWRDSNGRRMILGNFGVSREHVAQAIADRPNRLSPEMLKMVSMRFGVGNPNARPHSTSEIAEAFGFVGRAPTSGQAIVSVHIKKALRSLNLRPKSSRARGRHSK